MAAMFGQCLSMVTNCLYGEGGDWTGAVPQIPASQRIPEVILDTTTMGHEAVVVKNGLRLCGTGSARGSAPILQDKAYWEVICIQYMIQNTFHKKATSILGWKSTIN